MLNAVERYFRRRPSQPVLTTRPQGLSIPVPGMIRTEFVVSGPFTVTADTKISVSITVSSRRSGVPVKAVMFQYGDRHRRTGYCLR
ncbi:hypothetical protein KCP69_17590 [Salmonella enterica subsp. enterica]|nr:hypothetical protein KCP69_17590 [Salmonella enterica subsp. enterica]